MFQIAKVPTTNRQLKAVLKRLIKEVFEPTFRSVDFSVYTIEFNSRLKTTGGTMRPAKHQIRMNSNFKTVNNFLSCLFHEMAHGVEFDLRGKTGHGRYFHNYNTIALNAAGLYPNIKSNTRHNYEELVALKRINSSDSVSTTSIRCSNSKCTNHLNPITLTSMVAERKVNGYVSTRGRYKGIKKTYCCARCRSKFTFTPLSAL